MIKDDASIIVPTLKELKANFLTKKSRPIPFRIQQLQNLLRGLQELRNDFYEAFKKDLGYQDQFFCELAQYQAVVAHIQCDIKHIYKYTAKRSVGTAVLAAPAKSYIIPEPMGVVLVIGAWNYPLFTCLPEVSQAIGAGNAVVLKPSELVPNISNLLYKLITNYLDQSLYRVIEGGVNVAINITKQPFDLIIFTGGTEKGKLVAKAAAENLVPCILELGGKGPCIIDSSSDLALVGRRVISTKFFNCGQTCVAPDYLLVEETILDKVVETLKKQIVEFYGKELKNSQCMSRIVNDFHTNRIAKLLENHGGKLAHGGQFDLQEKWIEPTIVVNPDPKSAIMQEEIFGPLLPIISFKKINDAIDFINSRPKPLALYYFGSNKQNKELIIDSTSSGGVCVNDCMFHLINHELPFGGVGDSGYGVVGAKQGFDQCQHLKPVLEKSATIDPSARYPPYTNSKISQMNFLSHLGTYTQQEILHKLLLVILLLGLFLYFSFFCGCSNNKQNKQIGDL